MTRTASPPRRSAAPPPAEREPGIGAGAAAAIYFALSLVYFLPAFLPGNHIFGTDYLNAGYFFYDFISERTAAGHLPGWVPYVYGGLPLFSNPGSTYYPVRWLADLLGPTRLFFPILFWVQFGLAGWGMYLLAREMGARRWVAFVAGLAFQWTGILTSWVYAGHDGRIIVVTLAPLLFAALHAGVRTARLAPFAGAAATVGFALLSFQIQNAYYLLVAAFAWSVFLLFHFGLHRRPGTMAKVAGMGVGAVAFGFLLAAVNFLPFQDYVGKSPRGMTGGRGYEYSTSYSMPPRAVLGLAVPEQVGVTVTNDRGEYVFPVYRGQNAFRLHTEYVGALVVVLLALGIAFRRRTRYWWFFAGLGIWALTMSLGGNTPLYRLYYEILPGLKRFRAPDLAYYVLAFSLICMAALTLERLAAFRDARAARRAGAADGAEPSETRVLWIGAGVAVAALLGAVVLGSGAAAMAEGTVGLTPAAGWTRFAFFAGAVAAVLWAWYARKATTVLAMVLLSVVTTADLWLIGKKFFQTVEAPEVMFAPDDITSFLLAQPGPFRFFPIPGQSAWPRTLDAPMLYDLQQAGGEHGNQLQRYNEFAGPGETTMVDFHNLTGDPRFMAAANVRYVVLSAEIQAPWLREAYRGQTAIVYENLLALPRAYFVEGIIPVQEPGAALEAMRDTAWDPRRTAVVETPRMLEIPLTPLEAEAQVASYEPDRVVVRTTSNRAAFMVLSDNWYEDWRATVDGREVPIYLTNHTFRGVVVPAGSHTVEFVFRPDDLYTGFWIYVGGFAVLAMYGLFLLVRRRRGRARADAAEPAPA